MEYIFLAWFYVASAICAATMVGMALTGAVQCIRMVGRAVR